MSKLTIRLIIILINILGYGLALFQFQSQFMDLGLPEKSYIQFLFLFGVSGGLSLILFLSDGFLVRWILTLRAFIILFLSHPSGDNWGMNITLVSTFILEAMTFSSFRNGLSASLALIITSLIIPRPRSAWHMELSLPTLYSQISYFVFSLIILSIMSLYKYFLNQQYYLTELSKKFSESTLQLAQANLQLQEYAVMAEQEAIANERKRLASEIHDTLAYTLTNLVMMLEAAIFMVTPQQTKLRSHLGEALNQAKAGLLGVRRALNALCPVELAEDIGLVAIYRMINTFVKATKIDVDLSLGDAPLSLGKEVDWVAYRLVQEGIVNALRHGKANKIYVSFNTVRTGIRIQIKDNGTGSVTMKLGYGLAGMKERIERLGGSIEVRNCPGEGFLLSAWMPLGDD